MLTHPTTAPSVPLLAKKEKLPPVPVRVFDALPGLIEAVRWGQQERFNELVDKMAVAVQDSRPALAESLRRFGANTLTPMRGEHAGARFAKFERPTRTLSSVFLPDGIVADVGRFVAEHGQRDELARYALVPRHRVLLHGPPGCGKTLVAECLANELNTPLLRVHYAMLVDSHLGETAKNLSNLLDYAGSGPCVLFFDEFDSVATQRGGQSDVGEMRRVTNYLLIHLERLNPRTILVAASNVLEQLDPAIVRRFDTRWELPAPTKSLQERCARAELSPEITGGRELSPQVERIASLGLLNLSSVVNLCTDLRRDYALNGGANIESIISGATPKS